MDDIRVTFEKLGRARELAANSPLLLNDPQAVWVVGSGSVSVFLVSLRNGEPVGARRHCLEAGPGEVLFGTAWLQEGAPTGLIAVGIPGTKVHEVRAPELDCLLESPEPAQQLAACVDVWLEALAAGIVGKLKPKCPHALKAGTSEQFTAREAASPVEGTVWVQHTAGESLFLGRTELRLQPADCFFPVPGPAWLEGQPETTLAVAGTAALLRQRCFWRGLARFHELLLLVAAQTFRDRMAAETDRLQRKASLERHLVEATLAQLAAVALPARAEKIVAEADENLLFAACRVIGNALGIVIQVPGGPAAKSLSDPLRALARASRVRVRRVVLSGRWWLADNGPLLGYCGDEERPVALVPNAPGAYEIVDPVDGTRTSVTEAVAATLRPYAYMFYRPLPPPEISFGDLVQFGLAGSFRDLAGIAVLGLAVGSLGMLSPIAMAWLFDKIIPGAETDQLLVVVMALVGSAVVATLFRFTQGIAMLRVETRTEAAVEAGIWDRLLNLPLSFFRKYSVGDLTTRALGLSTIRRVLTEAAWSSLVSVLFSSVSFVLLFVYAPKLAVLTTGILAVIVVVTWLAIRLQLQHQRKLLDKRGKTAGLVLQIITGISRLRVAGAERRALAIWARQFGAQRQLTFQSNAVANNLAAFSTAAPTIALASLYSVFSMLPGGQLSLGSFLAFNAAFTQILVAAEMLAGAASSVIEVVPLYERAQPILKTMPETDLQTIDPGDLSGDIEVNHVSFRYRPDTPLVLNDVSFHVRPGDFVAFVGPSGAGKSSLLRLLLGFESPNSGSIYFDRQDLGGLNRQGVRRQIGVVLQNGKLIVGDIFSNIVGSSGLTLDDAWEAARLSGFDQDVAAMPMGMFSVITEGENILSGGQKQRLMIARAIASRPRILFFDEATSALDNTTQAKVRRSLQDLKATRVVVAHRLSTVIDADRIYVMDAGRIVQQGRYDELSRQAGLFADLVKRQVT